MNLCKRTPTRAFTLLELLTVVAIITLLMGIVVPALNNARNTAKRTKTQAQLSTLGKGCESFVNDNGAYPRSHGTNPFETDDSAYLSGAQWLTLQMAGADLRGYVRPVEANDAEPRNGAIDHVDWRAWYQLSGKQFPRLGPYVPLNNQAAVSLEQYLERNPRAKDPRDDGELWKKGSSDWKNDKLPFFLDAFDYPILYYAANTFEKQNAVWKNKDSVGRYDQTDNAAFTGSAGDGRNPTSDTGFEFSGSGEPHKIAKSGFTDAQTKPVPDTFTFMVYDRAIFKTTQQGDTQGRIWPHNPDTFLLISPGKDGVYGTDDDVRNFEDRQ